jgi:hypothetical protein
MKRRFYVLIICSAVAVLYWIFWRGSLKRESGNSYGAHQAFEQYTVSLARAHQIAQTASNSPIIVTNGQNPSLGFNASNRIEAIREKWRGALEAQNVPIVFYGRVVDQTSNGLPEVTISTMVRHWDATNSGAGIRVQRVTDADGTFEISGVTGDAFSVESIQKQGYDLEPGQHSFGPIGTSPNDPFVFKMWRSDTKQNLITGQKAFHLVPDGRLYAIDLRQGLITEQSNSGDFKVWIKRPDDVHPGEKFDWNCGLQVLNGGVLEETNAYSAMFIAPTEGYSNEFKFEAPKGWPDSLGPKRFYLQLGGTKMFGRATIEFYAYYNQDVPALIRIEYALNSSGAVTLR